MAVGLVTVAVYTGCSTSHWCKGDSWPPVMDTWARNHKADTQNASERRQSAHQSNKSRNFESGLSQSTTEWGVRDQQGHARHHAGLQDGAPLYSAFGHKKNWETGNMSNVPINPIRRIGPMLFLRAGMSPVHVSKR